MNCFQNFSDKTPSGATCEVCFVRLTHRSGSTLIEVMACCLTAPNHYLNNFDLLSMGFCGTHLIPISLEVLKKSIRTMSLRISDVWSTFIAAVLCGDTIILNSIIARLTALYSTLTCGFHLRRIVIGYIFALAVIVVRGYSTMSLTPDSIQDKASYQNILQNV